MVIKLLGGMRKLLELIEADGDVVLGSAGQGQVQGRSIAASTIMRQGFPVSCTSAASRHRERID